MFLPRQINECFVAYLVHANSVSLHFRLIGQLPCFQHVQTIYSLPCIRQQFNNSLPRAEEEMQLKYKR